MSRLIDADALLNDIDAVPLTWDGGVDINDLEEIIKRQPTAEPLEIAKLILHDAVNNTVFADPKMAKELHIKIEEWDNEHS